MNTYILAIESSCDDTSCAILHNRSLLSNVVAGQQVHARYGGVVPELASRDHQRNIVPVVDAALRQAGKSIGDISAIAVTRGPGLMGSLLVGLSFAKSLALALDVPLLEVNHMQAHILAHFIEEKGIEKKIPEFPFVCLTVSGGHTQLVKVNSPAEFQLLGATIDDAVGEAFDKAAKILGLPYPGGPLIDKHAAHGNRKRFSFATPQVPGLDYSFSGIKTSFLYFIRDQVQKYPDFVQENLADICASYQHHLVNVLMKNVHSALKTAGIKQLAIAGGVAANSELRERILQLQEEGFSVFIPPLRFSTDNAAMIGIAGYFRYLEGKFAALDITPAASLPLSL